jgi:hypothetical protein
MFSIDFNVRHKLKMFKFSRSPNSVCQASESRVSTHILRLIFILHLIYPLNTQLQSVAFKIKQKFCSD